MNFGLMQNLGPSASEGGYAVNCLTGQLYQEYDIFLPAPSPSEWRGCCLFQAGQSISRASCVRKANENDEARYPRYGGQDRYDDPEPCLTSTEGSTPTTMVLGTPLGKNLPLRITDIVPTNPTTRFDASRVTGSCMSAPECYVEFRVQGLIRLCSGDPSATISGTSTSRDERRLQRPRGHPAAEANV